MNKIKTFTKRFFTKRGLASVSTAIKVCAAVLCGALLLVGTYGIHQTVVLPSAQEKAQAIGTYESTVGGGTSVDPVTPTVSTYQLTVTFQNDRHRIGGKVIQHYESSGALPSKIVTGYDSSISLENPVGYPYITWASIITSYLDYIANTDDYEAGDIPSGNGSWTFEVEEGTVIIGDLFNGYFGIGQEYQQVGVAVGTVSCSGGISISDHTSDYSRVTLNITGDGEIVFSNFDWNDD